MEDAVELARRSIYHATFRDAVSGGTVSGNLSLLGHLHLARHTMQNVMQESGSNRSQLFLSILAQILSLLSLVPLFVSPKGIHLICYLSNPMHKEVSMS